MIKKISLISFTIFMFFFNNNSNANYEKIFFDFKIESITGEIIDLNEYRNKVVLLVNTASFCGFTNQYEGLQNLWNEYKKKILLSWEYPQILLIKKVRAIMMLKNFVNPILILTFL